MQANNNKKRKLAYIDGTDYQNNIKTATKWLARIIHTMTTNRLNTHTKRCKITTETAQCCFVSFSILFTYWELGDFSVFQLKLSGSNRKSHHSFPSIEEHWETHPGYQRLPGDWRTRREKSHRGESRQPAVVWRGPPWRLVSAVPGPCHCQTVNAQTGHRLCLWWYSKLRVPAGPDAWS